jgi:Mrp family chromosome partitioning ATPase
MLSPVAEGIVFLIRANRISRDILTRNLQMLRMLDFKIMGAVFNDFDIKKEKYYYGSYYHYHYYYYYYYYYSYGYGTEEDKG